MTWTEIRKVYTELMADSMWFCGCRWWLVPGRRLSDRIGALESRGKKSDGKPNNYTQGTKYG